MAAERNALITYGLLVITGAAVEFSVALFTGAREAWDAGLFWNAGLPALILATFLAGLFGRGDRMLHGLCASAGLFIAMTLRTGEVGSMVGLGLLLVVLLGSILGLGSYAGAAVQRIFIKRKV